MIWTLSIHSVFQINSNAFQFERRGRVTAYENCYFTDSEKGLSVTPRRQQTWGQNNFCSHSPTLLSHPAFVCRAAALTVFVWKIPIWKQCRLYAVPFSGKSSKCTAAWRCLRQPITFLYNKIKLSSHRSADIVYLSCLVRTTRSDVV